MLYFICFLLLILHVYKSENNAYNISVDYSTLKVINGYHYHHHKRKAYAVK